MDAHLIEATIKTYLTEIRNRLDKAAGIGRAADACAGAGFHEKGLEVALDIEQLLYEAKQPMQQHDCSGFARLRRSGKHVWHRQRS